MLGFIKPAVEPEKSLRYFMIYFCCCLVMFNPLRPRGQAPLSVGFSRQECWSGFLFPFPGELPDPEIKPASPELHVDCLS